MIAYKLFRELKDGSISPLFINKKLRLKLNEWLTAESHPTKGFVFRQDGIAPKSQLLHIYQSMEEHGIRLKWKITLNMIAQNHKEELGY